jgi:hypothetical protein
MITKIQDMMVELGVFMLTLLVLAVSQQTACGDESKLLTIVVNDKTPKYGDPVSIEITKRQKEQINDEDIKFRCYVLVEVEGKGFVDFITNLESVADKPIDLIYNYSASKKLTWNYKNKPQFLRPDVGKKYKFVIKYVSPRNAENIVSDIFVFHE